MPQTIQIRRSTANAAPVTLAEGEMAFLIPPSKTVMYVGDGANVRCLMSTDPADNPEMTADYLALAGGTMLGVLTLQPGEPTGAQDAVPKSYVDRMVTELQNFVGTWQVAANNPDISGGAPTPGDFYIAITVDPNIPEAAPANIPGIAGQLVHNSDYVIWDAVLKIYQIIRGSTLTKQEADTFYVFKDGDTMTGRLTLSGDPTVDAHAATKHYVDVMLGFYLPLAGGVLTGGLVINTTDNHLTLQIGGFAAGWLFTQSDGIVHLDARAGLQFNTDVSGDIVLNSGTNIMLAAGGEARVAKDPTTATGIATKRYVDQAAASGFTGVVTDISLVGNGMPTNALSVNIVDGGLF